ncbi:MAG: glutamine synthetase [Clostridia bacterium]|nr:glutamine synthetase [Clostridia bacterium]
MNYDENEIMQYMQEEDVKFVRLAFCDVFGKRKNISILTDELPRAFTYGIAFDASAISGFGDETHSDLFLHPDLTTLTALPWRPEHGRVVQMISAVKHPDNTPFECDTRRLLQDAVKEAAQKGYHFSFGAEQEFYLFKLNETGAPTKTPCDEAGYMDIAPEDRGENVRREICLTLEQMGIRPESSHHEEGHGQNEIDFRYADPLTAADHSMLFQTVVKTVSHRNGYYADFSAKPIDNAPGNGFHINISVAGQKNEEDLNFMIAGILEKIREITVFLNPTENSYLRLGKNKAPGFITWSKENRSQLVRIPAAEGEYKRIELRSADPTANPYLAFTLIIYAALYGIEHKIPLCKPTDINLFNAKPELLKDIQKLPQNLNEAKQAAINSDFVREHIPAAIINEYCG